MKKLLQILRKYTKQFLIEASVAAKVLGDWIMIMFYRYSAWSWKIDLHREEERYDGIGGPKGDAVPAELHGICSAAKQELV